MSRPVRGAWIEIPAAPRAAEDHVSRPVRGAWIEIGRNCRGRKKEVSRPVRGAWIEIWEPGVSDLQKSVAPP